MPNWADNTIREEDPAMDEEGEEPHTYTWPERTIELKE